MKLRLKPKKNKPVKAAPDAFMQPSLALQLVNRYLRWILLLVIAIMLFVGYILVLSVKIKTVQEAAQQNLPAKERILTYLQDTQKRLDERGVEFGIFKEQKKQVLNRLEKLLPDGKHTDEMFAMFEYLASSHDFELTSINIAVVEAQTSPPPSAAVQRQPGSAQPGASQNGDATAAAKASADPKLKEITITISVSGKPGYEEFKKFIGVLEQSIRLFDIKSIAYQEQVAAKSTQAPETAQGSAQTPSEESAPEKAQYQFELTTYYQE